MVNLIQLKKKSMKPKLQITSEMQTVKEMIQERISKGQRFYKILIMRVMISNHHQTVDIVNLKFHQQSKTI